MPTHHFKDFTLSQAQDLARHFLGESYFASVFEGRKMLTFELGSFCGPSWRSTFRAAGVKLPFRPKYSSVDHRVVRGDENVAIAMSATFAQRIANALNDYEPDARGK